jgi:ribosome maturation factor RimP
VGESPLFYWPPVFFGLRKMSRQTTTAQVEEIAARVAQSEGIEIVEVELKGTGRNQLLRISIDKPGGVTHGDCETITRLVGEVLDQKALFEYHYTLEVSSPGVERKLKKQQDFTRFQGEKAKVVYRLEEGKNKHVEGTLAGMTVADNEASAVLLDLGEGQRLEIPFDSIERANLKFEW